MMTTISDLTPSEHPHRQKSIVLIGMPGSGKSTIGRKLALALGLPFVDSDQEVEIAAGMNVSQIFERLGEPAFREGERKVIARLLQGPRIVLSTGGGAFMNESTRLIIKKYSISIWLKASLDVLVERTSRTDDRPLLRNGDPREILTRLMAVREPVFAQADLVVQSENIPIDSTTDRVAYEIKMHLEQNNGIVK
jgi:shikimate kinase